jgi:hypothetical protein
MTAHSYTDDTPAVAQSNNLPPHPGKEPLFCLNTVDLKSWKDAIGIISVEIFIDRLEMALRHSYFWKMMNDRTMLNKLQNEKDNCMLWMYLGGIVSTQLADIILGLIAPYHLCEGAPWEGERQNFIFAMVCPPKHFNAIQFKVNHKVKLTTLVRNIVGSNSANRCIFLMDCLYECNYDQLARIAIALSQISVEYDLVDYNDISLEQAIMEGREDVLCDVCKGVRYLPSIGRNHKEAGCKCKPLAATSPEENIYNKAVRVFCSSIDYLANSVLADKLLYGKSDSISDSRPKAKAKFKGTKADNDNYCQTSLEAKNPLKVAPDKAMNNIGTPTIPIGKAKSRIDSPYTTLKLLSEYAEIFQSKLASTLKPNYSISAKKRDNSYSYFSIKRRRVNPQTTFCNHKGTISLWNRTMTIYGYTDQPLNYFHNYCEKLITTGVRWQEKRKRNQSRKTSHLAIMNQTSNINTRKCKVYRCPKKFKCLMPIRTISTTVKQRRIAKLIAKLNKMNLLLEQYRCQHTSDTWSGREPFDYELKKGAKADRVKNAAGQLAINSRRETWKRRKRKAFCD